MPSITSPLFGISSKWSRLFNVIPLSSTSSHLFHHHPVSSTLSCLIQRHPRLFNVISSLQRHPVSSTSPCLFNIISSRLIFVFMSRAYPGTVSSHLHLCVPGLPRHFLVPSSSLCPGPTQALSRLIFVFVSRAYPGTVSSRLRHCDSGPTRAQFQCLPGLHRS
ncbi:hypothetical protein BGY98DRAFT_1036928 [Russula aff. rugulosa BPL654]|nr:hypothetical protein BGY98DRAFT_1036928 [Russula aff. rugulosa BPL654]